MKAGLFSLFVLLLSFFFSSLSPLYLVLSVGSIAFKLGAKWHSSPIDRQLLIAKSQANCPARPHACFADNTKQIQ